MPIVQNTQEWLQCRKSHIGASDAPIIMGASRWKVPDGRYKTPLLLWQEKIGLADFSSENPAMAYGRRMEEPARQEYEKMTRTLMSPEVIFHAEVPYAMASLDGLSMDKTMAVEIKNCNEQDHLIARNNQVPDHYVAQVQHQLDCLNSLYGTETMHYFSFHGGEGIIVEVRRDADYIEELRRREARFWQCVQNFEEPELCDLDYREMDELWRAKAEMLWHLEEQVRNDNREALKLKEELKTLSNGLNSRCRGLTFSCSTRRGSVDYSRIPELIGVNLESYRKTPVVSWSLKRRDK